MNASDGREPVGVRHIGTELALARLACVRTKEACQNEKARAQLPVSPTIQTQSLCTVEVENPARGTTFLPVWNC